MIDRNGGFPDDKFEESHGLFLEHMASRSGREFSDFEHELFCSDEIHYKHEVLLKGQYALALRKWPEWQKNPGRIIEACKKACNARISKNLLEHRYGKHGGSSKALYRVETRSQVKELEAALLGFIGEYPLPRTGFGKKLDLFAEHLMSRSLGCNWAFVSYIAFLADHKHYFPIRPKRFDHLLEYYGSETRLSGRVEWQRYQVLMTLADWLSEKLSIYGEPTRIRIQSYMWIVSSLLTKEERPLSKDRRQLSFEAELRGRMERATNRERIGLRGEQVVFQQQVDLLLENGMPELAARVRLVSAEDASCGYDILSFDLDGSELHIEVKTTPKPREFDVGFYITGKEISTAKTDRVWRLYRVRDIDGAPEVEDLGNLFTDETAGYTVDSTAYFIRFNYS